MKTFFVKRAFLYLLCLSLSFNLASLTLAGQGYTVIEGQIHKPFNDEASVTIVTDLLKGEKVIVETPVDQHTGQFKLAFKPSEPMMLRFEHAFDNMQIYVKPGDRLFLNYTSEMMWKTMRFSGDGAADNNYLVAYYNRFGKEVDQAYIDLEAQSMSPTSLCPNRRPNPTTKTKFLQSIYPSKSLE